MRYRQFRLSKRHTFGLLMAASALSLVLPKDFLQPARNLAQLIAPTQWAARRTGQLLVEPIKKYRREPIPAEEHDKLLAQRQAQENENASLRQQLTERQATIDGLTLIRAMPGFPAHGALIPARVLGLDAAAARDSLLVGKGSMQNIKRDEWVASRLFVDAGSESGVRDQLNVLAREYLIGWVEQTGPFAARVVLLSDLQANKTLRVRVAPRDVKRPALTAGGKEVKFVLEGAGRGRMRIPEISRDFVETGLLQAGDLVTSDPADPRLPVAMVIGKISEVKHNQAKPVYYDATVMPLFEAGDLDQVFVVDVSPGADTDSNRAP